MRPGRPAASLAALLAVAAVAAPGGRAAPAAGGDTAHVYGVDTLGQPAALVYGVLGYFKVRGTIDPGPKGTYGLTLTIHPVDASESCPSPAPQPVAAFDKVIPVLNSFDQDYTSGIWTGPRRVRVCFYFTHHDNSQTQSSEVLTFRDPVDRVVVRAPNLPAAKPGTSRTVRIRVTGETDHGYSGLLRVHRASRPCSPTYSRDAGPGTKIASPGAVRLFGRYSTGNPIRVRLGPVARGRYRVCAWLGPASKPVARSTTTFVVG